MRELFAMHVCVDDYPSVDAGAEAITRARPTDLSERQWEAVLPLMPTPKSGGRPRTVDLRAVLNAIRYVVAGHCSWRRLPDDLPRWGTVHSYYWIWRSDGTWKKIEEAIESGSADGHE